ncbi:SAF domain-containing protein [Actinospongicola halichondriae]|uniref:SAF domain-containing protein n=1 Tax=Actinospongicola halichondriae TaxID=3236844 RepID=UPI003D469158
MRPSPPRFPVLRPPPRRLLVVLLLALVLGTAVHRTTSEAAARAAALGTTRPVAVARQDLDAGQIIRAGDVELVDRPVAHLPDDVVVDDPTGLAVRSAVVAGEVLTGQRLAGDGHSGAAALVPEGWRAVAIPVFDAIAPTQPGDLVDVIASFDPALSIRDPSLVIAADAVVVDVADDAVTVAVTRERVTEVAFALANGIVTLALVG